ncbi:hypothetical protein [Rodentibacter pneumotropicus]|uniref:Uncharacterized protein n=1 Tax=Rodentibacter pneumotropicus TaxID=758 RepID=A0A4S2PSF8_9PAST|nr:hypothetical protein [Rodentibacter pneumotropicus]THA06722.1 hypothetical protein D3M77_07450 [Rodentibacter pneumotropicus]THA16807.1 hypothetical protein D3M76_02705 [Rodentibacter pneumotropicus]
MNKYEALGRYIEAEEEFNILRKERELLIEQIDSTFLKLKNLNYTRSEPIQGINDITERTEILLPKLKETNEKVRLKAEQMNQYADLCNKPKIDIK